MTVLIFCDGQMWDRRCGWNHGGAGWVGVQQVVAGFGDSFSGAGGSQVAVSMLDVGAVGGCVSEHVTGERGGWERHGGVEEVRQNELPQR